MFSLYFLIIAALNVQWKNLSGAQITQVQVLKGTDHPKI